MFVCHGGLGPVGRGIGDGASDEDVICRKKIEMNIEYGNFLNKTEAESDWSLDFLVAPFNPHTTSTVTCY